MHPITLTRCSDPESAVTARPAGEATRAYVAGGTTLIDLMKLDVMRPDHVIDITRLDPASVVTLSDGGLRIGAIAMGIGMALLEDAVYDPRSGRVVNDNPADYLIPEHLGTPAIETIVLDQPDPHIGEFGARGMGEIGITGLPAAVANAVYHATGRRLRDLPITAAQLLAEVPDPAS